MTPKKAMSPEKNDSRLPVDCKFCNKAFRKLTRHLNGKSMKDASKDDIMSMRDAARNAAYEHLEKGMVVDYRDLEGLLSLPEDRLKIVSWLEETKHIIINKKSLQVVATHVKEARQSKTSEPSEEQSLETDASETKMEDMITEQDSPPHQRERKTNWSTKLRKAMTERGFYNQHNLDKEPLAGYINYMKRDKEKNNWSQEAGNISKFLYYMDPKKPSLNCVRDIKKTQRFFNELSDVGLAKQTLSNYLKSVKSFVRYIVVATSLSTTDPELYTISRQYLEKLEDISSTLSKQVSKADVGKRHQTLMSENTTLADCVLVLNVAKPKFLEVFGNTLSDCPLSTEDSLHFLYYLEALLMLKHMQCPSVVKNMTVEEWCTRKEEKTNSGKNFVISVRENKTGAQAVATISLDQEEEAWMDVYYKKIRPEFLKSCDPDKEETKDIFFISSTGSPIYNPSNDLSKFQRKHKVPPINSQRTRRVSERILKKYSTDAQKELVAEYLSHTPDTAEKHLKLKTTTAHGDDLDLEANKLFQEHFPVTVSGKPPHKKMRINLVGSNEKACNDTWRVLQQKLRIQDVIDQFPCRRPSERQVKKYIDRQEWLTNQITPTDVLSDWKPAERMVEALDGPAILKLVKSQRWKGLIVKDDEIKGKTVMTTRIFAKDEVVCDYHGIQISKAEGKRLWMATGQDAMGYFFYKNSRGQGCCIDAHTVPCPCHPDRVTYGRLINHSKKNNLKPIAKTVKIDGKDQDIIYLKATRPILCDEELSFDYGVRLKSF
ncbi:hypothetical protein UPYG_G00121360 [Umbra pygmaea]|uniref:SET domain-containing protein n=1 Tax=Umbra pygmaea TaxID=75934 RepID=A0ABD0X8N6_UMBPY